MKKLPFDAEEVNGTTQESDFWWWFFLFIVIGYFAGRSLVTVIWGI